MTNTVEILYRQGVPIDIREMRDGLPRQYGRGETPARGYIAVRLSATLKDIDPEYLECSQGGKFHLNEALFTTDEKRRFKDQNRYQWKDHAIKHTITPHRLAQLCTDKRSEWLNKMAAAETRASRDRG